MPLELTARIESTNLRHTTIGVFQNGGKAGTLTVETMFAEQVLRGLNGLAAFDAMESALEMAHNELCRASFVSGTDRRGLDAAIDRIRAVMSQAREAKGVT